MIFTVLRRSKVFSFVSILLIVTLLIISLSYWYLIRNGQFIYMSRSHEVNVLVSEHRDFFETIFTQVLPATTLCHQNGEVYCTQQAREKIEQLLVTSMPYARTDDTYYHDGKLDLSPRLPMYFIQFGNNTIVKLFLSGDLKIDSIDTQGERAVRAVLLGQKKRLYGIQANEKYLRMTYLNDLYSEAEVIVPVKMNEKIVGAIVFLHGD